MYTSRASVDYYLETLSNHLESLLEKLTSSQDFALLADETTDVADQVELSSFIRYEDKNNHYVKEDSLCLDKVKGSKGANKFCQKIVKILAKVSLCQTLVSVIWMEQIITCVARYPDYNIVFIIKHPIQRLFGISFCAFTQFLGMVFAEQTVSLVWKRFKYFLVKAAVFQQIQKVDNPPPLKILQVATTC